MLLYQQSVLHLLIRNLGTLQTDANYKTSLSRKEQPVLVAAEVVRVLSEQRLLTQPSPNDKGHEENGDEEKLTLVSKVAEPLLAESSKIRTVASQRKTKRCYSSAILERLGIMRCEIEEHSSQFSASTKCEPIRPLPVRRLFTVNVINKLGTFQAYKLCFSPPRWLLNEAWEFHLSMACSGWTFGLRTYVTVPEDSIVFDTLKFRTWDELVALFRDGRASPLSVTPDGWTLLHVRTSCLATSNNDRQAQISWLTHQAGCHAQAQGIC
jgi:hypothetical protein